MQTDRQTGENAEAKICPTPLAERIQCARALSSDSTIFAIGPFGRANLKVIHAPPQKTYHSRGGGGLRHCEGVTTRTSTLRCLSEF